MKYRNAELLDGLHSQTEEMLGKAIGEWQMMSPERFTATPAGGGWSAAQCLDHLNGYGDYYLPQLERAVKGARERKQFATHFRSGWLGDYFTRLMQPAADGRPSKKMKAFRKHIPGAVLNSDAVIATFITQQEKTLELLDLAMGIQLENREVAISIAPMLKLKTGDTFRFLIAHCLRHAAQAERALAALSGKVGSSAALLSR